MIKITLKSDLPPWVHPLFKPKDTFMADTTAPERTPAKSARNVSGFSALLVSLISLDDHRLQLSNNNIDNDNFNNNNIFTHWGNLLSLLSSVSAGVGRFTG
jgi:hypothetical protein